MIYSYPIQLQQGLKVVQQNIIIVTKHKPGFCCNKRDSVCLTLIFNT